MERIEILRALAAARNAFNETLEQHNIIPGTFDVNNPETYCLYITGNKPGDPLKCIAKIKYKQTINC